MTYRYRLTKVVTEDYGDGPGAGQEALGTLAAIPDGAYWRDRPEVMNIRVPLGTRPGGVYRVSIESEAA